MRSKESFPVNVSENEQIFHFLFIFSKALLPAKVRMFFHSTNNLNYQNHWSPESKARQVPENPTFKG